MLRARAIAAHAASHRALRVVSAAAERAAWEVEAAADAAVLARSEAEAAAPELPAETLPRTLTRAL
jgi:hypothetical protein